MDFKKCILYWWLGAWANEKNIYEFGFHSSPLCSLGADVPGCSLGKPAGNMAGIREHGDLENHPADAPLPSGPSSLTKGKQSMLGSFPSPIAFDSGNVSRVSVPTRSGVLLLASQNMKSSFWPITQIESR